MSIEKNQLDWECMANHVPQWMENLSNSLSACMSDADRSRCLDILDEYNKLTDREDDKKNEDAFSLYGVEQQKEELANEFIKINEKYKEQAMELQRRLEDDFDSEDDE